jgi:4-hydroxybenzoate polyprenyltransferase
MARRSQPITYKQIALGFSKLIRWQNLLIVVFTQLFTRIFLIGGEGTWQDFMVEKPLWLIIFATVLIAASGYIINDYYDIKIDLINKPTEVIVGRYIKRRWALGLNFTFNGLGVLLGLLVSLKVFAINLLATFCLWVYSNQLKRLPFWGNLMVALMTGLSIGILAVYYKAHNREVLAYAVFAFWITLIREIIKDMEDFRGDARHGCKTLPIVWGYRRTKEFLFGLMAIFVLLLFSIIPTFSPSLLLIFSLLLIPLGYIAWLLYWADTQKKFHQLSTFCKYIMLVGILSMGFV